MASQSRVLQLRWWLDHRCLPRLRRLERGLALALVLALAAVAGLWLVSGLGFAAADRAVELVAGGRRCRPLANAYAAFLVFDGFLFWLTAVAAIGEGLALLRGDRMLPTSRRDLALVAGLSLVLGLAGIAAMRSWC